MVPGAPPGCPALQLQPPPRHRLLCHAAGTASTGGAPTGKSPPVVAGKISVKGLLERLWAPNSYSSNACVTTSTTITKHYYTGRQTRSRMAIGAYTQQVCSHTVGPLTQSAAQYIPTNMCLFRAIMSGYLDAAVINETVVHLEVCLFASSVRVKADKGIAQGVARLPVTDDVT